MVHLGIILVTLADTDATFGITAAGGVSVDGAFCGSGYSAGSADVAEWVPVSESAGAVLVLDGTKPDSYHLSRSPCSALVARVVSTQPGMVLGTTEVAAERVQLALCRIVPVKVTDEGGPIWHPRDFLSSWLHNALHSPCPCALVGKALESFADGCGEILVLLTAH